MLVKARFVESAPAELGDDVIVGMLFQFGYESYRLKDKKRAGILVKPTAPG